MLFFLKYAKSEDLALTHKEFKKQAGFKGRGNRRSRPDSYFGKLHLVHGSSKPEAHLH